MGGIVTRGVSAVKCRKSEIMAIASKLMAMASKILAIADTQILAMADTSRFAPKLMKVEDRHCHYL